MLVITAVDKTKKLDPKPSPGFACCPNPTRLIKLCGLRLFSKKLYQDLKKFSPIFSKKKNKNVSENYRFINIFLHFTRPRKT